MVAVADVGLVLERRDGPAVVAVVHLVPPPVEHRAVDASVQHGLHPARSARLVGSPRGVEPHVASLVEAATDGDVVVLHERHAVTELRTAGEAHDPLDQLLALVVGGMGLAGEHELQRPVVRPQECFEALGLGQQQGRPLVAREAAGEPDCQRLRIEVDADTGPHDVDQPLAPGSPRLPQLGVPQVGGRPRRRPRRDVHSVGDGIDLHVEGGEHLPADVSMQL